VDERIPDVTTTAPTTTTPCRRWLQFSLRTLLVLMLVLGAGLGWLAHEAERARAQRKLAAAIEQLGGRVEYRAVSGGMIRIVVVWWGKLLGEDLSGDATYVHFRGALVSDAGLAHLQGLTQLQAIDLHNSQVSDAGVAHLRGMSQLRALGLWETQVSDAGLAHLRGLTQLQQLFLDDTQVGDAGLAHLRGLKRLQRLDLNNTQVSDAGLVHLRGLTQLQVLFLDNTQVSDAGLVYLQGLTQLRWLSVRNTKVTEAGVAELQKALPNLTIYR
jgi:hypothetical protein